MISEIEMKRLKTHAKKHKGGMKSKHMKNMIKIMSGKDNIPFIVAHRLAVKMDNETNNKKKKKY